MQPGGLRSAGPSHHPKKKKTQQTPNHSKARDTKRTPNSSSSPGGHAAQNTRARGNRANSPRCRSPPPRRRAPASQPTQASPKPPCRRPPPPQIVRINSDPAPKPGRTPKQQLPRQQHWIRPRSAALARACGGRVGGVRERGLGRLLAVVVRIWGRSLGFSPPAPARGVEVGRVSAWWGGAALPLSVCLCSVGARGDSDGGWDYASDGGGGAHALPPLRQSPSPLAASPPLRSHLHWSGRLAAADGWMARWTFGVIRSPHGSLRRKPQASLPPARPRPVCVVWWVCVVLSFVNYPHRLWICLNLVPLFNRETPDTPFPICAITV